MVNSTINFPPPLQPFETRRRVKETAQLESVAERPRVPLRNGTEYRSTFLPKDNDAPTIADLRDVDEVKKKNKRTNIRKTEEIKEKSEHNYAIPVLIAGTVLAVALGAYLIWEGTSGRELNKWLKKEQDSVAQLDGRVGNLEAKANGINCVIPVVEAPKKPKLLVRKGHAGVSNAHLLEKLKEVESKENQLLDANDALRQDNQQLESEHDQMNAKINALLAQRKSRTVIVVSAPQIPVMMPPPMLIPMPIPYGAYAPYPPGLYSGQAYGRRGGFGRYMGHMRR